MARRVRFPHFGTRRAHYELLDAAGEPIEAPHEHDVELAAARIGHQSLETGPLSLGTTHAIGGHR